MTLGISCPSSDDDDDDDDSTPPLAAPVSVVATAGDGEVTVEWDAVPNAAGYDLCYATETIADFDNCAALTGGMLVMDVTNPHTVTGLTNGTQYFFRVAATRAAEQGPPSAEVSATPVFTPIGGLNDTGITKCGDYAFGSGSGNDQNHLDCASPGGGTPATADTDGVDADGDPVPAGQDAHFGRDVTANDPADGAAGFSFTKVCNSGEIAGQGNCPADPALGSGADDWACTRDNVTGLIWEVKVDDAAQLRHNGHNYSWFNSTGVNDGGDTGTQNGGNCTGSDCDTEAFVTAVNTATLCGASDWRLPTAGKLLSIAHLGVWSPAIDTDFFPNRRSAFYWSSSPFADGAGSAWGVDFRNGLVDAAGKDFGSWVRLVRAGQLLAGGGTTCDADATENAAITATTPTADFVDNGDGTVTHIPTGLMWKRCSQGQSWDGATCTGVVSTHNWAEALAQADSESFAGHTDWRLPNAKELESIVERRCYHPTINVGIFPGTESNEFYWSSSPFAEVAGGAWSVSFGNGDVSASSKDFDYRVRLVRAGQ